jgi:hypothetical protein
VGFKGFGLGSGSLGAEGAFECEGKQFSLKHGSVVIAAITSCTNTSNPSVMLGAGKSKIIISSLIITQLHFNIAHRQTHQ